MASIVRRDGKRGPSWQVKSPRDARGHQATRTFRVYAEAVDYAAELRLRERRGGTTVLARGGGYTFEEWSKFAMGSWRKLSRSSRHRYQVALDGHVIPFLGDVRIDRIDSFLVESLVGSLEDAGLAPGTIRTTLAPFRKAMLMAVRSGLVPASPLDGLELATTGSKARIYLTPAQVEVMADAAPPAQRAYVYVAAYCGLRPGELFALRWSDVELDHEDLDGVACAVIHVARTIALGASGYYEDTVKTAAGARNVPVPVGLVLDELLLHKTRTGGAGDDRVFPPPSGDHFTSHSFRHVWSAILAASRPLAAQRGVRALPARGLTPHKLRHTAVAIWIKAGADAVEVKTRAGHASVAYTLDTYGGLFPDRSRVVDRALDVVATDARIIRQGT